MLSAAKLTRASRTWKMQGPRAEKTVFQPADIDGGTQNVNNSGSSPKLASSQSTLFSSVDLEDCENDRDVNYISPNNRKKKKKKKKKKNTGSADATSSMVDENAQDEDPIPNSTIRSDHETSLSTAAVHNAGIQSTLSSTPKESDKHEYPIQSGHAVKKKDKSKKTEITDSGFLGDDPKNGHKINGCNKDCASNDVGSVEMPLWADDRKEGIENELKTDKVTTERTDDQCVSVTKKEILVEPNYMYSDVDALVTEPMTSLESTVKTEHAGFLDTSNGIKANPVNSGLRDVQAEKEEPGSCNEEDLSDLSDHEGRNIQCIFKLVYGVGLRALRKLFMQIHPSWSNKPSDAAALNKGKIHLGREEEASFKKGNIDEWDFSLMTSVLLYTTRCALDISKRPGFDTALRELKKCRNKLLGHPSTDWMSDGDFNYYWPLLSSNFIVLGADPDDIAHLKLKTEKDLIAAELYKQLFLAEQDKHAHLLKKLDSMDRKLDTIIANRSGCGTSNIADNLARSDPKWDEWLKFRDAVGEFDTLKNQYIVTDSVPSAELEWYSTLRGVAWKMILDFDPMSEEKGFYRSFTSKEWKMSNLVSMFTPAELKQRTMKSLLRQIDPNKIQWLFVNGRAGDDDGGRKEFSEWEASSVKDISSLFRCCSDPDTFDELKPVVCLILPFSDHSGPYLQVTLSRLTENFNKHNMTFVSINNQNWNSMPEKLGIQAFDLCPKILNLGLTEMLGTSTDQKLRMPTSHAGVLVNLSPRQYLYIKEYLEILYIGCENLPEDTSSPSESQEQQERYLEEQRKSFLSGNEISFASLFDNHDARREIEKNIEIHVQRLLQGLTRPIIVEIRHSPGAGGTTIARRVLWDLHKEYPCMLMKVSSHHYSDEDNIIAHELAERIVSLEEICNTTPLILFDGKQPGATEGLSNKLTRILQSRGKRALILRCLRGTKASSKGVQESSHVHPKVFHVNVKLEESISDLNEFKSKYKEYLDTIDGSLVRKQVISGLCRVFHFPLLSMMEEFRPKLEKIIEDTFNELGGIQQEIAVVVAFLQKYANFPTPAILLHEAFKQYLMMPDKKIATYDDVKELFSEYLMNLMIPAKPTSFGSEKPPESYTFQHPLVADLVLKRVYQEQKRDLFEVVERFLQFPIYQQETLLPLVYELFIYNKIKQGQAEKLKFSLLFEELKVNNSDRAAEIFCKAAEKINHPVMYGNAARFCARKEPPSFAKAKDLIQRALQVHQSTSKGGYKNLCHAKGVVLYFELKYMINSDKVEDLARLEEMASKVLEAYRQARNFPPTYPHPLIGEVEVWLQCISWIMNNICNRDAEETLAFVTNLSPPFFRTCVSDSFHLLDVVDDMVQSVSQLADPAETKRLSNSLRLTLMKTFRRRFVSLGRLAADEDIIQACRAICTTKHFRESSQLELKRLQAHFILTNSEQSIENLKNENLEYLLKLLEDLVLKENEYRLAHHLMKVCMLVTGPRCYSLEQGLHICEKWLMVSAHDCLPDFYQMVICFLQILDGNTLEFMPKYIKTLEKCQDKSQNHLRRLYATLYVCKEGQGMSRLISRNTLLRGETDYAADNFEKVSKFWQVESRKKLLECKGRIRVKQSSSSGKSHLYIELVQGNIELYVGKNADIGKVPERDFTPGALVYFVVSFNLQGPVANGITLAPQDSSNG